MKYFRKFRKFRRLSIKTLVNLSGSSDYQVGVFFKSVSRTRRRNDGRVADILHYWRTVNEESGSPVRGIDSRDSSQSNCSPLADLLARAKKESIVKTRVTIESSRDSLSLKGASLIG